jgi:hypothetical protein
MDLQKAVREAFENVAHPGNHNLLREGNEDDSDVAFLYPYERSAWFEIDRNILVAEGSCLSALSDPGLLYVIPAYLLEFVREDCQAPNGWIDRLLQVLASKGRGHLSLTQQQLKIIDESFLGELEKEWQLSGKQGTSYGDDYGALISQARSRYRRWE